MQFDFDELVDRKNSNSYKWQVQADELPMWVADMDFKTAPCVVKAIEKRLLQDAFGYSIVSDDFKQSIIHWWQHRHHWTIQPAWILFCTGAIPAISSMVRKLTEPNDKIVVLSPIYNIFYNSISNNQREIIESPMLYSEGNYQIDFADLEKKLADTKTSLLIFCNPHNPTGQIWDKTVLKRIGELCVNYQVTIISDELHCDLTYPNFHYTPLASISKAIEQITITCVSASKAFNLAGLQSSAIIIANETLRTLVERGINTDEVAEPNVFAIQAMQAAFDEGEEWLITLNQYLAKNLSYLQAFLKQNLPQISLVSSQATYLVWLDCSQFCQNSTELADFIREKTGLIVSSGSIFRGNGASFLRLNYACPKVQLSDGLTRLQQAIIAYQKYKECFK